MERGRGPPPPLTNHLQCGIHEQVVMQCSLALCGATTTTTTTKGRDCAAGMQLLNALAMSCVLPPAAGPRGLLLAGWGRRLRECPLARRPPALS